MNRTLNKTSKRNYEIPVLMRIVLDNDISLILNSEPPYGPDETNSGKTPEYFNSDPSKSFLV